MARGSYNIIHRVHSGLHARIAHFIAFINATGRLGRARGKTFHWFQGGPVSQTFSSKFLSKGGGGGGFGHKFLTQILPFIFAYVSGFSHFLGGHKSKTFRTPSELVPHYKVPPLGGSGLHNM